ncbi:unnamed protein product [Cuscuta campestris]|uniref:Uncharacterized protein n=1 Tax=Cuscuta campestris TaxID=132261 RepID=A0A484L1B7_9ASTE|nr:unnamed protein product [Cuscuta campestris]
MAATTESNLRVASPRYESFHQIFGINIEKIHRNFVTASLISLNQLIRAICIFQKSAHLYMGYKEAKYLKYLYTITTKKILKHHGCFSMPTKPRQDTPYSLNFNKQNLTKHIQKIIRASYLLKPF